MRGRIIRGPLLLALVAMAGAGAVTAATVAVRSSAGTVSVHSTSSFGNVLVGPNGHTLYRFTVDSKNVNRCSGVAACASHWPALLVKAGAKPTAGTGASAGMLGTIAAAHGMMQVTYGGFPLYYFSGDTQAGQTNGQGLAGKWYVVSANGALVKHTMKAATTTTKKSGGNGGWA